MCFLLHLGKGLNLSFAPPPPKKRVSDRKCWALVRYVIDQAEHTGMSRWEVTSCTVNEEVETGIREWLRMQPL
jgi:hypothetical protein